VQVRVEETIRKNGEDPGEEKGKGQEREKGLLNRGLST